MKEGYTEYIYKLYFRINAEHCYGPISSSAIQHVETLLLVSLTLLLIAAAAKLLQSCLTLQPHRRQPTRLSHPWDSPGKNTGVGCHFLLQCMKVKREVAIKKIINHQFSFQSQRRVMPKNVQTTAYLHSFHMLLLLSRISRVRLCMTP